MNQPKLFAALCALSAITVHADTGTASNLRLTVNGGTAVLRWTGTAGVMYQAESATSIGGSWQAIGSPTTDFSVTNILTGPRQFYRVGIYTNTTQYLANAAKSTGDKAPPTVPLGLTASAASCNQVNLYWSASTDQGTKVGGTTYTSGVKGYNIYRGGVFLKQVLAPATSASDTSAAGSTSYSYTVVATDNAGNSSSPSSPAYVTTPACAICTVSINANSIPTAGGTVSGGGTVGCSSTVTLTATANSGYNFVNWTENSTVVSSSASYTFSASANRTLVANFAAASAGTLSGCWSFDTANVSGTTVSDSSGSGNSATLLGNPLPTIVSGKTNQAVNLDGVSDLVSVADSASLNIRGAFSVAAWVNFNALPASSQYPNIIAKLNSPSSCYGYGIYWTGSGVSGIVGSGSPSWTTAGPGYTPTVGVWNHYVVVFDGANLKLYVNGALFSQTAASAPGDTTGIPVKMGAHYSNPSTYGYVKGKVDDARIYGRALSATEVTSLYNSAGSGSGSVTISASSSPAGAGSTSGAGSYSSGSTVTVTATPASCYTFVNWTENSTVVSSSASYSFTATANRNLVANFAQISYNITTSSSPSGAGTMSGGGTKGCGSSVTVAATAYSGYSFANWTENGNVVSTSASYSFTVNANRNLVANFTSTSCPLTISLTSPSSGATVSSTITLTASANACVTKVEFYCDNQTTPLATDTASPFTASCNTTVMANGSHSFYARAYDAAGNWATSAGVTATINNTTVAGGQLQWLKTVQNALTSSSAMSYGVVADRAGNFYSVGAFSGTIDFGQGSVTSVGGGYDCFIVKYNTSGGVVWVKTMGGSGTDSISSIAIDSQDNIIVTGGFHNVVDFGGVTLTSQGGNDMFVAKYSSAGVLSWAKRFGGTWEDFGSAVAVDGSDNIFLAARFQSQPADFGGLSLSALGWYDIALVKLTSAGSTSWAKRWGGTDQDLPTSIAIDRYGDLLVCGQFWSTTDVGGGSKTSVGGSDMFVAKYSSADGTCKWSRVMGGVNDDNVNGITTDPNTGNVLVTGGYSGTINFGGGSVISGSGGAAATMFVAAYDNSGNFLWVKSWGGDLVGISDTGVTLKVDGTGNLALTGYYNSWMDFNQDGLEDAPGSGYFVAAFTISGNAQPVFKWAKRSSTGTGIGNAVGFDGSGHVFTSGSWQAGTFTLGGISASTPGTGAFVNQYTK